MRPHRSILLVIVSCAALMMSGFTIQPSDERSAQEQLPQSQHALWGTFSKATIRFDNNIGKFKADIPDEINSLSGQTLSISGFILPLEAEEKFTHFLLSRRTPTCPYCPPGEPNEVIEVFTNEPIAWDDALVNIKGQFELIDNQDMGLFFRLKKAQLFPQ